MKIMASSPITSWQIDGETMETVTDYFLWLQTHHRWDCSPETKTHILLGNKAMTNQDNMLKSRGIIFTDKGPSGQCYGFPVVMYGCESWTIKQVEHWRIDVFELWCWTRLLRVPWTARSNQSILRDINPGYTLEGLMLKPKLQYFGHLMQRVIRKDPDPGKDWRQEEKGMTEDEMVGWYHWLDGHEFEQALGAGEGQGGLECCIP